MKSNTKKIFIQAVLVLIFVLIGHELFPAEGGGNMAEIYARFLTRHILICIIGLLLSDVIVFARRPRLVASAIALIGGFVGAFVGGILGVLSALSIEFLTGTYYVDWDIGGLFVVSIISMVLSYNLVAARIRI